MAWLTDIEIAQQCKMKHITEIAKKYDVETEIVGSAFDSPISDTESYAQVKININADEGLFEGLAPEMDVWSSHKDEVKTIPEEFEILASSTLCDVESFKHEDKDVYGIQFHPEVHHTPKGEIIFKNFYKICQK